MAKQIRRKDPRSVAAIAAPSGTVEASQGPSAGSPRPRPWRSRGTQAGLLFLGLLAVYLGNGEVLPGNDPVANVHLAKNLVSERRVLFTPEQDPSMFAWQLLTSTGVRAVQFGSWDAEINGEPARVHQRRGALINPAPAYYLMPTRFAGAYADRYGIGAALFAVPFVAVAYPLVHDVDARAAVSALWFVAKLAAAVAVAATAVLLFLSAVLFVRPGLAIGLALAYGLGTCAWSSSSQTLWQHGPMDFFLALGTYFLLRDDRARWTHWVGLSYALAFVCRPTAATMIAAAAVYYAIKDRRAVLRLIAGGAPVALLLLAYNVHYFGQLLALGQLSTHATRAAAQAGTLSLAGKVFNTSLSSGLAGILISPSRGMLVFSPIIAFGLWGLVRVWRDPRYVALRPVSVASVAMCLMVARWYGWWGGWCYGYRLLIDAVTLLAFSAIPVLEDIRRHRGLLVLFVVGFVWSVFVQAVGALAYDVSGWNNRVLAAVTRNGEDSPTLFVDPVEANRQARSLGVQVEPVNASVDNARYRARLWSIRDSEILYYVEGFAQARQRKRFLVQKFMRERGW